MTRQHMDSLLVLKLGESNLYNNKNNNIIYIIPSDVNNSFVHHGLKFKNYACNATCKNTPKLKKLYSYFLEWNKWNSGTLPNITLNNNIFLVTKKPIFVTTVPLFDAIFDLIHVTLKVRFIIFQWVATFVSPSHKRGKRKVDSLIYSNNLNVPP